MTTLPTAVGQVRVRPRTTCHPTAGIAAPSDACLPLLWTVVSGDGDGAGHADRRTALGLAGFEGIDAVDIEAVSAAFGTVEVVVGGRAAGAACPDCGRPATGSARWPGRHRRRLLRCAGRGGPAAGPPAARQRVRLGSGAGAGRWSCTRKAVRQVLPRDPGAVGAEDRVHHVPQPQEHPETPTPRIGFPLRTPVREWHLRALCACCGVRRPDPAHVAVVGHSPGAKDPRRAPRAASARAIPRPMPEAAPVTKAVSPLGQVMVAPNCEGEQCTYRTTITSCGRSEVPPIAADPARSTRRSRARRDQGRSQAPGTYALPLKGAPSLWPCVRPAVTSASGSG